MCVKHVPVPGVSEGPISSGAFHVASASASDTFLELSASPRSSVCTAGSGCFQETLIPPAQTPGVLGSAVERSQCQVGLAVGTEVFPSMDVCRDYACDGSGPHDQHRELLPPKGKLFFIQWLQPSRGPAVRCRLGRWRE